MNFYGGTASATSWSDTQIVAAVPPTASSGPVSVTVGGITAYGPNFALTLTVQLTDSLSNSSTYKSVLVGGEWRVYSSQGSGCSTCTMRGNLTNTYDSHGNVLTATDALGNVTTNTYDGYNNLLSVSKPLGGGVNAVTSYTYNSLGKTSQRLTRWGT